MKVELLAWTRGAVGFLAMITALVALVTVPVLADDSDESEETEETLSLEFSVAEAVRERAETAETTAIDAEISSYHINPQDFVGTGTVVKRVATNRLFVFDDAAFPSFEEDNTLEAAVNRPTPSFRAALANPFQDAAQQAGQQGGSGPQQTGNDPRDFGGKVMPYYRFTKLSNGLETSDFTLFGMWAWSKTWAMTYEFPFARRYDLRGTEACSGLDQGIPCFGDVEGGGSPQFPLGFPYEGDGVEVGMGDSIFRLLMNTKKNVLGSPLILGVDMNFPTATKDILGSETFTIGPIFTFVWDMKWWPAPGSFFAMMNIFQIDVWRDSVRGDVNRYIGRWFLQLPVQKSQMLYIMIEMQPIYDFEADHFSFWFGPEFGKAFKPSDFFQNGGAIYFKPGWGISPDPDFGDRDWSFEFGFRYFLPPFKTVVELMGQD